MITLHHCHQTRSMRSLWLLNELGVDFRLKVYPFDKTLRSEEFLGLNPAGRVPAIEIGDTVMWESGAITEYLCELYPDAGMGRGPGHPERAEWLTWVHFCETISQHAAALTQQHVVLYEDHMRSPTVMKIETKRLGKCYEAVEGALADGRDYLLTSGFSAADVSVGQAIYMARHFAETDSLPNLSAWYGRLEERKAFRDSLPPEGSGIYKRPFYPVWDT
ncbi:MAG: glutathione S-transferase family protein [Rhodobacteraceae bacterium]|nr:glutathione S-transferase family protein [Paracoccaceae bacterium]